MDPAAIAAKYQNRAQNLAGSKEKEDMRCVSFLSYLGTFD